MFEVTFPLKESLHFVLIILIIKVLKFLLARKNSDLITELKWELIYTSKSAVKS